MTQRSVLQKVAKCVNMPITCRLRLPLWQQKSQVPTFVSRVMRQKARAARNAQTRLSHVAVARPRENDVAGGARRRTGLSLILFVDIHMPKCEYIL